MSQTVLVALQSRILLRYRKKMNSLKWYLSESTVWLTLKRQVPTKRTILFLCYRPTTLWNCSWSWLKAQEVITLWNWIKTCIPNITNNLEIILKNCVNATLCFLQIDLKSSLTSGWCYILGNKVFLRKEDFAHLNRKMHFFIYLYHCKYSTTVSLKRNTNV